LVLERRAFAGIGLVLDLSDLCIGLPESRFALFGPVAWRFYASGWLIVMI